MRRKVLVGTEGIYQDQDRVVLIKPMGCVEKAQMALLTAEHWRQTAAEMELPDTVASDMSRAILLVLGAGGFAPSLQLLFRTLLFAALDDKDGNANCFMFHNPNARVLDPLHRIESTVLRSRTERRLFETWLGNTRCKLYLECGDPIELLRWLDHYLNQGYD